MTTNIFEKILYGIKIANDNIIVLNDKMDTLIKSLSYEETEPNDVSGMEETTIGNIN